MTDGKDGRFASPDARWAGVGPYFAMFPTHFSDNVVRRYSEPGDCVLDPFAGRGTALFSAVRQTRSAIGIEINPVGWLYAKAKLSPASQASVQSRLVDLGHRADRYADEAAALPAFFHAAFARHVRRFLMAARSELNWRRDRTDWTLMALLLINLHGKAGSSLSCQMRQTKGMSPSYAVAWWRAHDLRPPDLDPVDFMRERIAWRYRHGRPKRRRAAVYLGDAVDVLPRLAREHSERSRAKVKLIFTSPPYQATTNYFYDQWLRLWLLGGPTAPRSTHRAHERKFESSSAYSDMLVRVFKLAAAVAAPDATVYVRTHARPATLVATRRALRGAFPRHHERSYARPYPTATQTALFGQETRYGEMDLVLKRGRFADRG